MIYRVANRVRTGVFAALTMAACCLFAASRPFPTRADSPQAVAVAPSGGAAPGATPILVPPAVGNIPLPAAVVQNAAQVPPEQAPRIVFDTLTKELGTFPEGPEARFSFDFENKGKGELLIQRVDKACGCTSATSTRMKLRPGQRAQVQAGFNTVGHPGKNAKTITVLSNDPVSPSTTLSFSLTVVRELELQPDSTLSFGDTMLNTKGSKRLKLVNHSGRPVKVTGLKLNNPRFRARVVSPLAPEAAQKPPDLVTDSAEVRGPNGVIELEVSHDALTQLGNQTVSLQIQTTHPTRPEISQWVRVNVVGDLLLEPLQVRFNLPKPDAARTSKTLAASVYSDAMVTTQTARISSRGRKPFSIVKTDAQRLPVRVDVKPQPDGSQQLLLTYLGGVTSDRPVAGRVQITTDRPDQPTLELPVMFMAPRVALPSGMPRNSGAQPGGRRPVVPPGPAVK